jgi:glucan-binding YG repeat protein
MKKVTKGIIFALIYALVLSLLPQNIFSGVAEAAEELQSVELENSYYVLDASLYEDTAILLGGEYIGEHEVGNLKVIAKQGDQTTTVIPEDELTNRFAHSIADTKTKFFFIDYPLSGDERSIYTIQKDTLKVKKETESKFYNEFFGFLEAEGFNKEDFDYHYPIFGSDGVEWVVFEQYSHMNDHGHYVPAPLVYVNKNGTVVVEEYEGSTPYIMYNKNGEIFYESFDSDVIVHINSKGETVEYPLPQGDGDIGWIHLIDNQHRLYFDDENGYKVYQLTEDKHAKYITHVDVDFLHQNSSTGEIWYQNTPEDDYSNSTYGYLNEDLSPKDVFHGSTYFDISIYKENVIAFNRDGYTLLMNSVPVAPSKQGWVQENGKWVFYDKSKGKHKGWLKSGGKWYLLDSKSGEMKTEWAKDKGKWYFLNKNGDMATGWLKSGGKWYLLNSYGSMAVGWQKSGGKWYFMNNDGAMATGWTSTGGKWYFMDNDGAMATGWTSTGGKWYFMDHSGAMKQGWLQSGSKWYFLQNSGAMVTGWQVVGGKWYYFYSSGTMAANTTVGGYKLGSSGAWIR